MVHATAQIFGSPTPGALGVQKVKYYKNSITKSISNIFKPNFVCLLTNERYKTFKMISSFGPQGLGLGGGGGQTFNFLNMVMWQIK